MKRKRSSSAEEVKRKGLGDEEGYSDGEDLGDEVTLSDGVDLRDEEHCSNEEDPGDEESVMAGKLGCFYPLPSFATDEPIIADLGLCSYCTRVLEEPRLTSESRSLYDDYIKRLKQSPPPECISCVLISLDLTRAAHQDILRIKEPLTLVWHPRSRVILPEMTTISGRGVITIDRVWERRPEDISELIDFQAVSHWLDDCQTKHTTKCHMARSSRHSMRLDVLLVDVLQNCLVESGTDCSYVALSYVWGGASMFKTTERNLIDLQRPGALSLVKLPLTVADAILMTKMLNQRYLWADCLSIVQDSRQKQHMIDNMDIIYAQATMTIIAASNRNANEGLPGVQPGSRTRISTSSNINHHRLDLHLFTDKDSLLRNTMYNSRGWTFQELLLSNRLLFVTEDQLTFCCRSSWRSESMPSEQNARWLLDSLIDYNSSDYRFDQIDLDVSRPRHRQELIALNDCLIEGYSERRLTQQDDKLNAFAGIAAILKELSGGNPVLYGMMTTIFVESLMWTFKHWESETSANTVCRLNSFPSWSWMGWRACVRSLFRDLASAYRCSFLSNVRILDQSGRVDASGSIATVIHQSATDSRTLRPCQLNMEIVPTASPATLRADFPCSIIVCNAQRSDWVDFNIDQPYAALATFTFRPRDTRESAGYLEIPPNYEMHPSDGLVSPSNESCPVSDLSLVRVAGVELMDQKEFHRLRLMFKRAQALALGAQLEELEKEFERAEETAANEFAGVRISLDCLDWIDEARDIIEALVTRLKQVPLLFVMLVRRHDIYWERVGSGLMRADCWPGAHEGAQPRSYEEEIRII